MKFSVKLRYKLLWVSKLQDTAECREEPVGLILHPASLWFPANSVFSRRRRTPNWALLLCTDKRRGEKLSQPQRRFFFPINCFKPPEWNQYSKFWMMDEKQSSCPASWERIHRLLCHCLYALLFDVLCQVRPTKAWQLFYRWGMSLSEHESVKAKSFLQSMQGVQNFKI